MTLRPIEQLAARFAAERDAALVGAPEERRAAGIVHTPAELARAVVRVADELVRQQLGIEHGLCDPELLVIDPACGPGAFLAAALALAEEREVTSLTGFATGVDAARLATDAVSSDPERVKAALQTAEPLHALGYDVDAAALAWAARLREHPHGRAIELVHADVLKSDVIVERVRQHKGPLAVIGNPPWATVRAQPSALDQARLEPFRSDASGVRLAERKLGVLSDAYVRFFALCAELARAAEQGAVVALVTNASFLDGPVHRGMRARLLEWFDEIAVLDLGGSALLGQQRTQRDDNVFGVRPNVAISWLCRYPRPRRQRSVRASESNLSRAAEAGSGLGRARYARRFGSRADKLELLDNATAHNLAFAEHACEAPAFSFVPRPRGDAAYKGFVSLSEWLPFHREGVQSNRDAVVVDTSEQRLRARLVAFCRSERLPELAQAYRALPHFEPEKARAALAVALDSGREVVQRIAYRPWDERVFCNVAPLCHRPRPMLSAALAHGGFALLSVRKDRGDLPWRHASAASSTVDNCYLSARSSCRTRAFPSYTPEGTENVGQRIRELLAAVGCGSCSGIDVQHYLLAVLSAASYQACWDSELHHDYPRIPPPPDASSFHSLVALGQRIALLHTSACDPSLTAPVPEPGACFKHVELDSDSGRVRLHGTVLTSVPPAALQLRIGQVQPLAAYLAQRAQLPLDSAGLVAVCNRAERLGQLTRLLSEVDDAVIECFGHFRRA